jgi:3-oxocholest-4-en-26-oyl-CoA dehydrogenase beta subunit
MDFALDEEQRALQDLAKRVFHGDDVWQALARAQLLGVAMPTDLGGSGLGLLELCLLLEQAGDSASPVPLLPALVMAGLPIAKFGSKEQAAELLPALMRGDSVLTAALVDSGEPVSANRDGAGFVLQGTRDYVPALELASRVLVPARTPEGSLSLFLIDPKAPGVSTERQIGTNEEAFGRLTLTGVEASQSDRLGDAESGRAILDWTIERATVAQCAFELGVARRALIMTAQYASERQQFNRPIGSFQAVAQRAADAYVDVETIRLTVFRAAWLLDQGRDAKREVAVAKLVAAEAGHRVVCAAQHIHGGIGFDRDYPLHRYFLASKQNEFTLGSASHHLARLGRLLAED